MDDSRDDLRFTRDLNQPSFLKVAMSVVLLLVGVGVVVGTIILFFYLKAHFEEPFPRAWRIVLFVGICASFVPVISALLLAGIRVVTQMGVMALLVGLGMLTFGFIKLGDPKLRFTAPLGFFIALAGGLLIWCAKDFANWQETESDQDGVGEETPSQ